MDKKEIAKKTGKTLRMIDYIINGERRPSANLAKKLEKLTGVPRSAWLWPQEYPNPYIKSKT